MSSFIQKVNDREVVISPVLQSKFSAIYEFPEMFFKLSTI